MCLNKLVKFGIMVAAACSVAGAGAQAQRPAPPAGGSSDALFGDALPGGSGLAARDGSMALDGGAADAYGDGPVNPFEDIQQAPVKSKEETEREVREAAFTAAVTGLLPLNPGEIRQLLKRYDETKQAVEIPIYPYPQPQVSVQTVSLDPGVTPPVIRMGVGHVTTINIMDASGQPWPIHDISWAGNFEVLQPGEGGHILRITPMSEFAYGNMSLQLVKMATPITLTLKTERDAVQYRLDLRVPEFGPLAAAPLIEGGLSIAAGDVTVGAVLDGRAPEGARKLRVSGVDGRTSAYDYNNMTYVRTPLTLLSPGWEQSVSSADGMNVYVMGNAPVLLLSDKGRVVRARLSQEDSAQ